MRAHRLQTIRRPAALQKQQGVVAILVAMTIVIMVGMVGLAVDLGQLFVSKSELQNAADACALAGVNAMPAGLESSESAASTVAQRHKVLFQKSAVGGQNSTVTVEYSQTNVNGPYQDRFSFAATAKPNYVKCTVNRSSIGTYFIQVLNALPGVSIGQQTMSAMAIAKKINSQLTCAVPVAACEASVSGSAKGKWIIQNLADDTSTGGGNQGIRWVDFSVPAGGASEVSELLTGPGQCALPAAGTEVYEPGVKASVAAAFNSRFGIYQGSVKTSDSDSDFSGYTYSQSNWSSQENAYADFQSQRASNAAYQGHSSLQDANGLPIDTSGTIKDSSFLRASGRDRRVVPVPVIDCNAFETTKKAVLKSWACVLMLHPISNNMSSKTSKQMSFEYLGSATDPTSPCASNGLPGGSSSSGPPVAALVR